MNSTDHPFSRGRYSLARRILSSERNSHQSWDLAKPKAPPEGGGTESDPPELLFSLARFDFLLFRLDDKESFEDALCSAGGGVSVFKIGSEEEAFSAAVLLALKRGNPEPEAQGARVWARGGEGRGKVFKRWV